MRKKLFTLLLFIFFHYLAAIASHYMGGEITWECLSNGRYRFVVRLYRECGDHSINYPSQITLNVANHPSITSITLNRISEIDMDEYGITCLDCQAAANGPANAGALSEHIFTSDASYPNGVLLSGIPPTQGWIFSYSDCCRNPCTNIANTTTMSWYLRAVMYRFNNQNAYPCFDNSPTFAEKPAAVLPTTFPFKYNHMAVDKDLDSLVYSFDRPMENSSTYITSYQPGYSWQSPLPNTYHNPLNQPATINPYTGEISFLSYTQGAFVTVTKVTAYKCGIKVAEIFREIQVVLVQPTNLSTPPNIVLNSPPVLTAPFQNSQGQYTEFIDTVYAGDLVQFFMSATDFQNHPPPNQNVGQTVKLFATSPQFGTNYTSTTTGCFNPPCATLSPPLQNYPGDPPNMPKYIKDYYGVGVNFSWQTDCNHISFSSGCNNYSNTYNFIIKAQDDICPVPGTNVKTITIVVLAKPILPPPEIKCLKVHENGDVTITWQPPADPRNSFNSYHIYVSNNINGPYSIVDSIFNYNQTTYTHIGANAHLSPKYYMIKTRSGCYGIFYSNESNKMKTIYLNSTITSNNNNVTLNWNPLCSPQLNTSYLWYKIYRKENNQTTWTLVDSTLNINYNDVISNNNLPYCIEKKFYYKIEIGDSFGCISASNIDSVTLRRLYENPIPSPKIKCVSVNDNMQIQLTWEIPEDSSSFKSYWIYHSQNPSGTFNLIDSITNFTTNTYLHQATIGNSGINYYYIITRSGCDGELWSTPDDTVRSIYLEVTNYANNTALITWNHLNNPNPQGTCSYYKIYKEYPQNVWTLLDSTINTNYVDDLSNLLICNPTQISYYVEICNSLPCMSRSNKANNIFTNNVHVPSPPKPKCISIISPTQTRLHWEIPDDTTNLRGYQIWCSTSSIGPFYLLTTINDINTFSYEHSGITPYTNQYYYYLRSIGICPTTSFSEPSDTIKTIMLNVSAIANNVASLSWNHIHIPQPQGTCNYYKIYREYPPGIWSLIDSTQNNNYIDNINLTLCNNTQINYYVEICNSNGCYSKSNISGNIFINPLPQPFPPQIKCVSVESDGSITIYWSLPIDTTLLTGYQIWYSTNPNGPYNMLAYINNYNTLSYHHTGINANNQIYYYYINSLGGCFGSNPSVNSDTVRSILLNVSSVNGQIATLNWNDIHYPTLTNNIQYFYIYKENQSNQWILIDSTTQTTWQKNIITCGESIKFIVMLANNSGCKSWSSIDSDFFNDNTPPNMPNIDTVSIDPISGLATISWIPNLNDDTKGYILYHYNGTAYFPIDTIWGKTNTFYIDSTSTPNNNSENYAIASIDSCGNLSSISSIHKTIYLTANLQNCEASITLNWNNYQNMLPPVVGYKIFVSKNNQPFYLLADVNTNTYIHQNVEKNATYRYFIRAYNQGQQKTSTSNILKMFANLSNIPAFCYLRYASVLSNESIKLSFFTDTSVFTKKYYIYRADSINGNFIKIDSLSPSQQAIRYYVDNNVKTTERSYYYYISVVDSCNNESVKSNIAGTILLKAEANTNKLFNYIWWNDYVGWVEGIKEYIVVRNVENVSTDEYLKYVPYSINDYTDDVSNYYEGKGAFEYYVIAIQEDGNPFNFKDSSYSNKAIAYQPPRFFVPNAFVPNGIMENHIFKPYTIFVDSKDYHMYIYNRWGELVFSSSDINYGWNGTINGKLAPGGVYAYYIRFTTSTGEYIVKTGTITLIYK